MSPQPSFDPGLTQKYTGPLLRTINKDGSFNVIRRGFRNLAGSVYNYLVTIPWPQFLSLVGGAYLVVNTIFATLYTALGPDALRTSDPELGLGTFARSFFFSVHTLTTVGYGDLYPLGMLPNILAAAEAALGLMGFALATGLLFARFSRPNARLLFSEKMLVAPYRDGKSLQFRVANSRREVLMEVRADMMLMTVERGADGQLKRNWVELPLERKGIFFLALTWTVVHPIDEASPLWGKTAEDLEREQAELVILLKGFDDSYGQVVHARYSYRWEDIQWSAKFSPAFAVLPEGYLMLDLTKISDTTEV
jgi:inward rectifier potassium channel